MHVTLCRLVTIVGLATPGLVSGRLTKPEAKAYEPLQIIRTVEMTYPHRLSARYVEEGEVRVEVFIDKEGRLADWMLTGYSHVLFAKEVLDVLPRWKFKPACFQGQPVDARTEMQFKFRDKQLTRVIPSRLDAMERMTAAARGSGMEALVYRVEELDQPLDAITEISPMPPMQLGATAKEGVVIVDYLVDASGRVRMPMIISSDDEAFSKSVLLAIGENRYAVPRHAGLPVITRVRQQFTFSPAP